LIQNSGRAFPKPVQEAINGKETDDDEGDREWIAGVGDHQAVRVDSSDERDGR
jgi:hypothetical protein